MRPSPLFAAAFAVSLASAAASAQTRAPDQTLGMALMSAAVGANGSLVRGGGVVSSARTSAGAYTVTFVRNIEGCVAVANAAISRFARIMSYSGSVIQVRIADGQNSGTDSPFTVLVYCTQ